MAEGSEVRPLGAAAPGEAARLRSSAFLWAFEVGAGGVAPLGADDLQRRLENSEGWIWLHLPLSDQRARTLIEQIESLPAAARELILAAETRVQIQFAEGWTYGVSPDLERDLEGRSAGMGRLQFAAGPRLLLTARRRPLRCVDELRRCFAAGEAPASPAAAWVDLVDIYSEAAEAWLNGASEDFDRIEDAMLRDDEETEGLALGPLRRELSRAHRDYLNLRSALNRAAAPRVHHRLEQISEHLPRLTHAVEDLDRECRSLQDRARLLHEELDTRIAAGANRSMRTLTVISTLLIPPTLIVGALGMNLEGVPFAHDPVGFAKAAAMCLAIVAGAYVLLRRWKVLP
jgi:zinc transporter